MQITAQLQGSSLAAMAAQFERLSDEGRGLLSASLNAAGAEVRHATVRAEARQTGLRSALLDRAQRQEPSTADLLRYRITSRGGDINLKYLDAKEVPGGVTAMPFGKATFFAGSFITSGPKGNRRRSTRLNGHVYVNVAGGEWGGKIEKKGSGVSIPAEMTKGMTAEAFQVGAQAAFGIVVQRLGAILQ